MISLNGHFMVLLQSNYLVKKILMHLIDIHIIENERVLKKEDQIEWLSVIPIMHTVPPKYLQNNCLKLCALQYARF